MGLTPEHLQHLTTLNFLDLRDNKLVKLPEEITLLQGLERLDLTNNDLATSVLCFHLVLGGGVGERWEVGGREGGSEGEEESLARSGCCRAWSVWTSPTMTWLCQSSAFFLFWVVWMGKNWGVVVGGGAGREGWELDEIMLLQGLERLDLTNNDLAMSVLCFHLVLGKGEGEKLEVGREGRGAQRDHTATAPGVSGTHQQWFGYVSPLL